MESFWTGQTVHPFWEDTFGESDERQDRIIYDCGKDYANLDAWDSNYSKELENFMNNQIIQIIQRNDNLQATIETVIKTYQDEYKDVSKAEFQESINDFITDIHQKDAKEPVWRDTDCDQAADNEKIQLQENSICMQVPENGNGSENSATENPSSPILKVPVSKVKGKNISKNKKSVLSNGKDIDDKTKRKKHQVGKLINDLKRTSRKPIKPLGDATLATNIGEVQVKVSEYEHPPTKLMEAEIKSRKQNYKKNVTQLSNKKQMATKRKDNPAFNNEDDQEYKPGKVIRNKRKEKMIANAKAKSSNNGSKKRKKENIEKSENQIESDNKCVGRPPIEEHLSHGQTHTSMYQNIDNPHNLMPNAQWSNEGMQLATPQHFLPAITSNGYQNHVQNNQWNTMEIQPPSHFPTTYTENGYQQQMPNSQWNAVEMQPTHQDFPTEYTENIYSGIERNTYSLSQNNHWNNQTLATEHMPFTTPRNNYPNVQQSSSTWEQSNGRSNQPIMMEKVGTFSDIGTHITNNPTISMQKVGSYDELKYKFTRQIPVTPQSNFCNGSTNQQPLPNASTNNWDLNIKPTQPSAHAIGWNQQNQNNYNQQNPSIQPLFTTQMYPQRDRFDSNDRFSPHAPMLKHHATGPHEGMEFVQNQDSSNWKRYDQLGSDSKFQRKKVFKHNYSPLTITGKVQQSTLDTLAEPEGEHECDDCGKTFSKIASLTAHIGRTHNIDNKRYPCPECPKTLTTATAVGKHLLTHRPKNEWPVACEFCGQRFQAKGDLPKHWATAIHEGDPSIPKPGTREWAEVINRSVVLPLPSYKEPTIHDMSYNKNNNTEYDTTSSIYPELPREGYKSAMYSSNHVEMNRSWNVNPNQRKVVQSASNAPYDYQYTSNSSGY